MSMMLAAAHGPQSTTAVRLPRWKALRFAAKECGVHYRTVLKWARGGFVEARREGRYWEINVESLKSKIALDNPWKPLASEAKKHGVRYDHAHNWAVAGLIDAKRNGNSWLVNCDSLKGWVDASKVSDADRFAWIIAEGARQFQATPFRNRLLIYRALGATAFGISIELLQSKSRISEIVHARQKIICFVRMVTGATTTQIGAAFGLDHTTVMHACRKYETHILSLIGAVKP